MAEGEVRCVRGLDRGGPVLRRSQSGHVDSRTEKEVREREGERGGGGEGERES